MTNRDANGARWDFYLARVDDRPASISLDLRYEELPAPPSASTLYWVSIRMEDATANGMGSWAESELLSPIEDELQRKAQTTGLTYVARTRNDGVWRQMFYGPPGLEGALAALASTSVAGRAFETGSKADPDWAYYHGFLLPDAERRHWMGDRKTVDQLERGGDVTSTPRRVDHWIYFSSPSRRDSFVAAVTDAGFSVAGTSDDGTGERPHDVQLFRIDAVELDHIHDVVMTLVGLAEQHDGLYDGWETQVTTDRPA